MKLRSAFAALALDLTPLRASRDFRVLYIGQFVSTFGISLAYVTLPWQAYRLTHSTLLVGLLGVAEFIPMILLAFVGGALADAFDRRRLVLMAETGLALCCAALLVNSCLAPPRVWVLFAISSLAAGLSAIHRPALDAITPRLVPAEQLPAVSALSTLRYSFNFIVGPAIAGLIVTGWGPAWAYGIDLACNAAAVVSVLAIASVPAPVGADRPSLRRIADGLRYAYGRQELLGTYLIDLSAMFFGMPIALFPALAEQFGGASVGLFYTMLAVGPFVATVTSGWIVRVHRHGLAVIVSVLVWGFAIVGFGMARNLAAALAFLVLAGGADCVSGLFRMTIWNQTIPDRLRGRLAGIEMISYMSGPYLGNAEAGLVAAWRGLRFSVVSGGVLCLASAGILAVALPGFRRYDAREGLAKRKADDAAFGVG